MQQLEIGFWEYFVPGDFERGCLVARCDGVMGLVVGDSEWSARVIPVMSVDTFELEVLVSVEIRIHIEVE